MKFLDHLEEWLVTFLMGAATLIIFVAVVHRYMAGLAIPGVQDWLLSLSLSWAQELTIIMFVLMCTTDLWQMLARIKNDISIAGITDMQASLLFHDVGVIGTELHKRGEC